MNNAAVLEVSDAGSKMPGMDDKKRKKPGRPPGRKTSATVYARVDPELEGAIDAYIQAQRVQPTQTAVVIVALQEFLEKEGFWPPPGATRR
jgi:hypothetical protein